MTLFPLAATETLSLRNSVTPQETANFVTITERIFNGKLHFFCAVGKGSTVTNDMREQKKKRKGADFAMVEMKVKKIS